MNTSTPNITKEELTEWRASHVTRKVVEWIHEEKCFVSDSFERGELLNPDNPTVTYGQVARAWGQLEALKAMIEFMSERTEDNERFD